MLFWLKFVLIYLCVWAVRQLIAAFQIDTGSIFTPVFLKGGQNIDHLQSAQTALGEFMTNSPLGNISVRFTFRQKRDFISLRVFFGDMLLDFRKTYA